MFMDINTLHKPPIHFSQMTWFDRFIVFCGVGFGSGLSPKAPGTFGSAFALLFVPLWLILGFNASVFAILLMSIAGIYICGHTAKVINVHDDGRIVWDEFAGQSITLIPLIYLANLPHWWIVIAFALFRLFDVWKPFPIGFADRKVHGGFGIMLDDLLAGLMAMFSLAVILYIVLT